MPASANDSVALHSAPVVAPWTVAPAAGALSSAWTTCTVTGEPVVAAVGPESLRTSVLLKASKTQSTSSPLSTLVWQPPVWANWRLTTRPQNWDGVALSPATCLTEKSLNELNQSASQAKPLSRAPSSRAAVAVGTGAGWAPALGPSQGWLPPDDAVGIAWPSVVTGPSKIVLDAPSTRRLTETGAAPAAGAATAAMARATGSALRVRLVMWPPLPRGFVWRTTGARSPGLGLS